MPLLLSDQKREVDRERIEKVLLHVERYKITLVHIVKRLFFPTYFDPDHKRGLARARSLLDSLVDLGMLTRIAGRSAFAKNSYVLPGHVVKEDADLARLWYCLGTRTRRHLCKFSEIKPVFEAEEGTTSPFHNFSLAIEDTYGGPVFQRLYLCMAEKRSAKEMIAQAIGSKAKGFRQFVDGGDYGVAVLVQSEQKKKEIEKLITSSHGGKAPLRELGRVSVSLMPQLQTLSQALRHHEEELWK